MLIGRETAVGEYFRLEYLLNLIQDTGLYGISVFVLIYVLGTLMNIPGMIFLFILFLVYDGIEGFAIGYFSTLLAMVIHFVVTRSIAGDLLTEIDQPFLKGQIEKLTSRPLRTTIILRLLLFISPPVNYALALSSVRFKYFVVGSMIAMPVNLMLNYLLAVYAKDWMLHWFA